MQAYLYSGPINFYQFCIYICIYIHICIYVQTSPVGRCSIMAMCDRYLHCGYQSSRLIAYLACFCVCTLRVQKQYFLPMASLSTSHQPILCIMPEIYSRIMYSCMQRNQNWPWMPSSAIHQLFRKDPKLFSVQLMYIYIKYFARDSSGA